MKKFHNKDIIQVTLKLLEKKGALKNLSFREIARELKCAHTNLYNYYSSFQDLIWDCVISILKNMQEYIDDEIKFLDGEERFNVAFSRMVQFAIEYPSFYGLIWLEKIEGNPPDKVTQVSSEISDRFVELLNYEKIDKSINSGLVELIHSYLHGELVKIVCNRIPENELLHKKNMIVKNIKLILLMDYKGENR